MGSFGGDGRMLAGRYRLVSQLGRGGMGSVWRAEDELLGRQVAVKELHPEDGLSGLDAQLRRERTLREARTLAQLKHPHVIVLHDVVEQDGHPWIVMELVVGESLADQLAASGPVPPREAARIVAALLDALRLAHASGVLHRDIKPANVLMEAGTGRAVLSDFGIAQVAGVTTITETGSFVGSPEYTAPERMSGRRTGPESDLWSLGVLLCTLVSGETPFRRDSLSGVLHAVMFGEIPLPAAAGPLLPVIQGLLERDWEHRLDAATAERLLRGVLDAEGGQGAPGLSTPSPPSVPSVPQGAVEGAASEGAAPRPSVPEEPPTPRAPAAEEDPTPQAPAPRPMAARRSSRARSAVFAAVAVVVLVGAGAGIATLLRDGGSHDRAANAHGADSGGSTGAPPASGGGRKEPQQDRPTVPAKLRERSVPAGYRMVTDPAGFQLALPEGFSRSYEPPRVYYYSPGKEFRIGIHIRPQDPEGPLGSTREADAKGPRNYPGYRSGQVIETEHHGIPAALWAFVWNGTPDDGGSRQTYELSWNEGTRMCDLWVSAPVGEKGKGKEYFDTAVETFRRPGSPY
ncbi:serine/threonine protein kinase [Streptomyces albus subsp. albus]|nr:serine/threonine protein kinase [Streptomyces albus subsp. albus]